jgi:hypothetical protein
MRPLEIQNDTMQWKRNWKYLKKKWNLENYEIIKRWEVGRVQMSLQNQIHETIERYNSRLVAKGYTQTSGINY